MWSETSFSLEGTLKALTSNQTGFLLLVFCSPLLLDVQEYLKPMGL